MSNFSCPCADGGRPPGNNQTVAHIAPSHASANPLHGRHKDDKRNKNSTTDRSIGIDE